MKGQGHEDSAAGSHALQIVLQANILDLEATFTAWAAGSVQVAKKEYTPLRKQVTNLEAFSSEWLQGNEPIMGVCETTWCGRRSGTLIDRGL